MVGSRPAACTLTAIVLAGCVTPWESSTAEDQLRVRVEDREGHASSRAWGSWSGAPGAAMVEGANVLKIEAEAQGKVLVRFHKSAFQGVQDSEWTVPVSGNVQWAAWEPPARAGPCGPTPVEAWQPTNTTGSLVLSLVHSACVAYRLVALPSPLLDQDYETSYDVARLA